MDSKDLLKGGVDAHSETRNLQEAVAVPVSEIQGIEVTPQQVAPTTSQTPIEVVSHFVEKTSTDLDLEDLKNTELGVYTARTNSSQNFLQTLWGRLRKKNPNADIEEVKKAA